MAAVSSNINIPIQVYSMQTLPALALFAILVISGCTTPFPTGGGAGVVIEIFEVDFSDAFEGEEITFTVRVRNTGSIDANEVRVQLLGLGNEWGPGTEFFDTDRLIAPSATFGTQGESRIWTFTRTAPGVPEGLPVTYTPTARVTYKYASTTIKTINIGSQDELRRIQNGGGALPSETTSTSSSPIILTVTNQGPIRVFGDAGASITFPLQITINNVGGGVVCTPNCANSNYWDRFTLKTETGDGQQAQNECRTRDLILFRGQSNTITCKITVERPPIGIVQKSITVEAIYEYQLDSTISVRVNPVLS